MAVPSDRLREPSGLELRFFERRTRVTARTELLVVLALTVLAFVLRLSAMRQSLYGDELFTLDDTRHGFSGVFTGIGRDEANPPLFFILAWAAGQLGELTTWIRLPSLLLGSATVPVVYALGRRAVGAPAGLVAAALVALSPFAIFYSTEARAYATMTFLVALSTLALLRAVDREGVGWWVCYAVSACGALYTHYTAVFVVVVQAGWAFWVHRDRLRTLVVVHAAIVVGYLPWLPSLIDQRSHRIIVEAIDPLSIRSFFDALLRLLCGNPWRRADVIPGRTGLALLVAAAAITLAGIVAARAPKQSGAPERSRFVLVCLLALATPLGLVAYDAFGRNLYTSRDLSASIPALAVLLGALLTSIRRGPSVVAVALVLLAVSIGAAMSLDDKYQRPQVRSVAHDIDLAAGPKDAVLSYIPRPFADLRTYFGRTHQVFDARTSAPAAWRRVAAGGSLFVVTARAGVFRGISPLAGPDNRFVRRDAKEYSGLYRLLVGRYQGRLEAKLERRGDHQVIRWSLGRDLEVSPRAAIGSVDAVTVSARGTTVSGWAASARERSVADWVLAFSGPRLLAVAAPDKLRPDVAKAKGKSALLAGYELLARPTHVSDLRVFGVVGGQATELTLSEGAKAALRRRR